MAICFDMQIGFLNEKIHINEFSTLLDQRVTAYNNIDFHPLNNVFSTTEGSYLEQLNVVPKNIGLAVMFDDGLKHKIDDNECFKLSLHMYEFLKGLPYYQIALVGWEVGFLNSYIEYNKQGNIVDIEPAEGLVVSNELFTIIKNKHNWVEFDSNHMWIPCESALGNLFYN